MGYRYHQPDGITVLPLPWLLVEYGFVNNPWGDSWDYHPKGVFVCPSAPPGAPWTDWRMTTIGLNHHISNNEPGQTDGPIYWWRTSDQITLPSELIYLGDAANGSEDPHGKRGLTFGYIGHSGRTRHNNDFNTVYVDGHGVTIEDVPYIENVSLLGYPWIQF